MHTGAMAGFTNIGDISSHLAAYEKEVMDEEEEKKPLAKSMLVIMVRGLFSPLEFPYTPCADLTG